MVYSWFRLHLFKLSMIIILFMFILLPKIKLFVFHIIMYQWFCKFVLSTCISRVCIINIENCRPCLPVFLSNLCETVANNTDRAAWSQWLFCLISKHVYTTYICRVDYPTVYVSCKINPLTSLSSPTGWLSVPVFCFTYLDFNI